MMIYDVKSKLDSEKDDNIVDVIEDDDKERLEEAIDDAQEWLQNSQNAEKQDWQDKVDQFDQATRPILKKYSKAGGSSSDSSDSGNDAQNDDFEFKDEL